MRKRNHGVLVDLAYLLLCGLLAGVVVAAAIFPVLALTGMATQVGADALGRLPDELIVKRSPQVSYLYAADGKTMMASIYDENRRDLPFSEIPTVVRQAILAAEDQTFYRHDGVDAKGIARAFIANKRAGTVQQGASTLTMQFVRLSIAYSAQTAQEVVDATEDTPGRKIREMRYALAVEQRMSKDEILDGYLNAAYFGNRAYGIYAAAHVYFDKDPNDLTVAEAAFIAALVKFPGDFDAVSHSGEEIAVERRNYVLDEMAQMQAITAEQAATARAEPLKVTGRSTPNGCVQTNNIKWGYFCDFVQLWWNQQEVFGATPYDRERALKSGGFRIVTSLDTTTQSAMDRSIDRALTKNPDLDGGRWTWKSDAVMLAGVEPGTGKVRGLAVNRNFRLDSRARPQNGPASNPALARKGVRGTYPNTTNPLITGSPHLGGYQAGSVMKIFTLVAALEKGYPLSTVINTRVPYVSKTRISGSPSCGGHWCPTNSGGKAWGAQNMWTGFGNSVNTFFVPLFEMTGGTRVIDTAKRMGLTFFDSPNATVDDAYWAAHAQYWGPFTLGASDHTPLQIANAFATLAADGQYCEPIPVESIVNSRGERLGVGDPRCSQNIAVDVARAATDAARCPVGDKSLYGKCNGSTARDSREIIGRHIAGKTGTTDDSKSVTLTITTKQLAISGFLTDPDWAQVKTHRMSHRVVNPAVQYALKWAMQGKPSVQFGKPGSTTLVFGSQVAIPNVRCKTVEQARTILRDKGLRVEVAKRQTDSDCPAGTVARTTPGGTTTRDAIVVLEVSNGRRAAPSQPAASPQAIRPAPE